MKMRTLLFVWSILLLAAISTPAQQLAPNSCSTNITSCGCVIDRNATYSIGNDLNANQTNAQNCIEIAASYSKLNVNGKTITGNGRGIGIRIRPGATHVAIQGVASQHFLVNDDDPCASTGQGVIFGWDIGIKDEGDYAVIGLFSQVGGSMGSNNTAGVYLNRVTGSAVNNINVCDNGVAGVIAKNSSGISVTNFTSNSNAQYGVWSDSTNDSTFATSTVMNNGMYGYWFMGSSRDQLFNANGIGGASTDTGVLFSCGGPHCSENGNDQGSNDNIVTNSGASGTSNVGILIQNHNHRNLIVNTSDSGNANFDVEDLNQNCDSNNWFNNAFGSRNQNCIQ